MFRTFSASVAVFFVFSSPVLAEAFDMSTIVCDQVMTYTEDEATTALIWLDGWLAGQADNTMLDPEELGKQVEGILGVCLANPSMSLMNAAKQFLAE